MKFNPTNKYHAVRSASKMKELAGRSFASQIERRRAEELILLQRAKEISDLQFQPKVMICDVSYHPDFCYREKKGQLVYEEVKGMEGERWRIIKQLWSFAGTTPLYVIKECRGKLKTVEILEKKSGDLD